MLKNKMVESEKKGVLHPSALKHINDAININYMLTPYGLFEFNCTEEEAILGLFLHGEPIGFCTYRHRYGVSDSEVGFQELEIYDLWIQPVHRHQGHAALFQSWLEDCIHAIGEQYRIPATRTFLSADPISKEGRRWYDGLLSKVYNDYACESSSAGDPADTLLSSVSP